MTVVWTEERELPPSREVVIFGRTIVVPGIHDYVAVDKDGGVYLHEYPPYIHTRVAEWVSPGQSTHIGTIDMTTVDKPWTELMFELERV